MNFINPDFTKSGEVKTLANNVEQLYAVIKIEVEHHMKKTGRFADVYKEIDGRDAKVIWSYYH